MTRLVPIALLLAACGTTQPADVPDHVLEARIYRFCHDPGFQASEAHTWCDYADELPPDRCPGFQETCRDKSLQQSSGCSEGGARPPGSSPRAPKEPWEPQSCDAEGCDASETGGIGTLLKWFTAFFVAAVLLVVVRLLFRFAGAPEPLPRRVVTTAAPPPADDLPDVPDLPSDDLLRSARQALSEGRYGDAVVLARGASLRRLGEAGKLRLHRSRTDREYVRHVRQQSELHGSLREVVSAVERHRWGGRPVDEALATGALAAAERILHALSTPSMAARRSGATVGLLLVAGLALSPSDGWAQGFGRHGPYGDAAIHDLLETWGYEVSWRSEPLSALRPGDEAVDALILDLVGLSPTDDDWSAIREWVEGGGVLIVAGPTTAAIPELGLVQALDAGYPTELTPELAPYLPAPRWPDGADVVFDSPEGRPWIVAVGRARAEPPSDDLTYWLDEGETAPVAVELQLGDGVVLGFADDRILANAFLLLPDNEAFLGDLLHTGQGALGWPLPTPIRVQLATRAAVDQDAPPAQAANPRMIPFVLQLMFTWTLLVLWRGWPFAVLRDPPDEGRVRFSDHVDALASRYLRAKGHEHAASGMARLWLHRIGPAGLLLAARRAGYDAQAAARLVADTESAAEGQGGDLELVEELWRVTRRR